MFRRPAALGVGSPPTLLAGSVTTSLLSLSLFRCHYFCIIYIYIRVLSTVYITAHTAVVVAVVVIIIVAVVVVVVVVVGAWLMHASQEVWRLDRCLAVPSCCR